MKKVLFIAKINNIVKELNTFITQHFRVQLCNYNADTVMGMMEVVEPDLVLISLIGSADLDTSVYSSIHLQYPDTPVFTIGDDAETKRFARYYGMDQFENLRRPITGAEVVEAISRKLGCSTTEKGGILDEDAFSMDEMLSDQAEEEDRKHVLVVDDNAGTLRSIKSMIESKYNVTVVPSGIKAVAMLGKKRPDLILLDYEMPVVDGRQTLEMIRAEEEFADIPVLFLTSVNNREQIQAVLALNPSGYLLKPPNQAVLMDAIEKALWK